MIQGGNPRSRSIQFECSVPMAINLGLMIHQHSTYRAIKFF